MNKTRLLSLLSDVLGKYHQKKPNPNIKFHCPFCNHHKKKLEINLDTQAWHCWVCDNKSRSIYQLFRKLNVVKSKIEELNGIIGTQYISNKTLNQNNNGNITRILPKGYKPLWKKEKTPEYKQALHFMVQRDITMPDILKYSLGYCDTGEYRDRIIIPSFDENGKLNYFVGRSFYSANTFKYKNPRWPKNIVGFDLIINWNEPVILVEGVFDAMAIRINAIPMFGKTPSQELIKKLVKHKPQVYVSLDNDAKREAIQLVAKLLGNGIDARFIELPTDEDPSSLGYNKFWELLYNTPQTNELDLLTLSI